MLSKYIKIPVQVSIFDQEESLTGITKHKIEKRLTQTSVIETHKLIVRSIKQNLDLLFLSQQGELFFDRLFGLEIWNHNFESKKLKHNEKKRIEEEIIRVIDDYEYRLKKGSHQVEVNFDDETKLIDGKKAELHILTIRINSVLNDDLKSKENTFHHTFKVPVKIYFKT